MQPHIYTIEELMLDDSFVSYCLEKEKITASHWETVIRDHPEQQETFAEAKNLILLLHGGLTKSEVNREIEKVRRALHERNKEAMQSVPEYAPSLSAEYVVAEDGRVKRNKVKRLIIYAAAACLLLLAGYSFLYNNNPTEKITQVVAAQFHSPIGQRQTVQLPDGSVAILNSNSSLSYTTDFNQTKRAITLTGDAFFTVAKNREKPFIVTAGNISTTALGTQFYVRSQPTATTGVSVALLEGKVRVAPVKNSGKANTIILLPGEKASSVGGQSIQKTTFDTAYMQHWLTGSIAFNKTPVLKAIQELEQWYDVPIEVKKEGLKNHTLTGEYKDANLQDILKVICFSINRRFTVNENNIIIE